MKSLVKTAALSAVLAVSAVPALSFAQSGQPLTRAQVRDELVQLEQAGYRPGANDPYYPDDLQAAQARIARQGGYGAGTAGTSRSGGGPAADSAATSYSPPVYDGHAR